MKLNESTDYAIRILILLAKYDGILSSGEISWREKLSRRYLFRIASRLRDANLLTVYTGPRGGYKLSKAPSEISLFDIMHAMEGPIHIPVLAANLEKNHSIDALYQYLNDFFSGYCHSMTLDILAACTIEKWEQTTLDYVVEEKSRLF